METYTPPLLLSPLPPSPIYILRGDSLIRISHYIFIDSSIFNNRKKPIDNIDYFTLINFRNVFNLTNGK